MDNWAKSVETAQNALAALRSDPALQQLHQHGWSYMPQGVDPIQFLLPVIHTDGRFGGIAGGYVSLGLYREIAELDKALEGHLSTQPQDAYAALGTTKQEIHELTKPLDHRIAEVAIRNFERGDAGWPHLVLFGSSIDLMPGAIDGYHAEVPSLKTVLERHDGAANLDIDPARAESAIQAAIKAQFDHTVSIYQGFADKGQWDEGVISGSEHDHNHYHYAKNANGEYVTFIPFTKLVELVDGDYDKVPAEYQHIINEDNLEALKNDGPSDAVRNINAEIFTTESLGKEFIEYVKEHLEGYPLAFDPHTMPAPFVDRGHLVGRQYTDMSDMVEKRDVGLQDRILEVTGETDLPSAYKQLDKYIHGIAGRMEYLQDISIPLGNEWPMGAPIPNPVKVKGLDQYGREIPKNTIKHHTGSGNKPTLDA